MNNRDYTNIHGKTVVRSDEELLEYFLEGYIDYYSGGELEYIRAAVDNLRRNTAKLLLMLDREKITKYCEETCR